LVCILGCMAARLFAFVVIGLVLCFLAGYLYAYLRVEGVVVELKGELSQAEVELSRLSSNHSVFGGCLILCVVWFAR
jgi:ABC-type xylose transport system permease subunit